MLTIFTDGSCVYPDPGAIDAPVNLGHGGWAWWVDDTLHHSGSTEVTTSLRMEIQAVIDALDHHDVPTDEPVTIATDSEAVIKVMHHAAASGYTRWERLPRSIDWEGDLDYWDTLADVLTERTAPTEWVKVKAHSGTPGNTHADRLARAQARVLAGTYRRTWGLGTPRLRHDHNLS